MQELDNFQEKKTHQISHLIQEKRTEFLLHEPGTIDPSNHCCLLFLFLCQLRMKKVYMKKNVATTSWTSSIMQFYCAHFRKRVIDRLPFPARLSCGPHKMLRERTPDRFASGLLGRPAPTSSCRTKASFNLKLGCRSLARFFRALLLHLKKAKVSDQLAPVSRHQLSQLSRPLSESNSRARAN